MTRYAIALGSNRRSRHGGPADNLRAAVSALKEDFSVEAVSAIHHTPALGPAGRAFANAALILAADLDPDALLVRLKALERAFGRRGGRRWGPRVLDLDIILSSDGPFVGTGLIVPHPAFRARPFVLMPLAEIASDWRDPITGLTVRQLAARMSARSPVDRPKPRA